MNYQKLCLLSCLLLFWEQTTETAWTSEISLLYQSDRDWFVISPDYLNFFSFITTLPHVYDLNQGIIEEDLHKEATFPRLSGIF